MLAESEVQAVVDEIVRLRSPGRHWTGKELTAIADAVYILIEDAGMPVADVCRLADPDGEGRGKRIMQRVIDEENRRADLRLVRDEEEND
jgi:hypothetical protein